MNYPKAKDFWASGPGGGRDRCPGRSHEGLRLRHPGRMRSHLHVSQEVAQAPSRPSRQAQGRASGVIGTLA